MAMETVGTLQPQTINRLNDLIRINIDSAQGFREAASVINDGSLRTRFEEFATQRDNNARELKQFVAWNDKEPEDSGSAAGAIHRWWLDLRAKAAGGDAKVVLSEAERGEDVIKHKYEDVLKDTAGSPVNTVLQRQYVEVKRGHDTIRNLRDTAKAVKG
jgi:uncharacterized protein (TIGR02284 family)